MKTDSYAVSDAASSDASETAEQAGQPALPGQAVTILVCRTCRQSGDPDTVPRPGSHLADATAQAAQGTGLTVKAVGCLGNCKRGLSAAMLRQGSWSYVFGELTEDSAEDLVKGALLYAGASDGFMPFRARPQSLKRGLIARLPTLDILKDIP